MTMLRPGGKAHKIAKKIMKERERKFLLLRPWRSTNFVALIYNIRIYMKKCSYGMKKGKDGWERIQKNMRKT